MDLDQARSLLTSRINKAYYNSSFSVRLTILLIALSFFPNFVGLVAAKCFLGIISCKLLKVYSHSRMPTFYSKSRMLTLCT